MVVSDAREFSESVALALLRQEGVSVIRFVGDLTNLVDVVEAAGIDTLLIDAYEPDQGALKMTRLISSRLPHPKIVILRVRDDEDEILKYIEAGASGYLPVNSSDEDLLVLINSVRRKEAVCSPRIIFSVFCRIAELTSETQVRCYLELMPREIEVLYLIAEGLSNKQIGERLNLSVHTVKNHVHNILEKLQMQNRSEVVHYIFSEGLMRDYEPD